MTLSSGLDASFGRQGQEHLLAWYLENRRDLPWRLTRDPYSILVSEVMLQQTQVDRVLPKYLEFLERFATAGALAAAGVGEVIRAWAPLGYNQRAVRLHRMAQQVVKEHEGSLPRDPAELRRLGGVGEYTAAAVRCFAFEEQIAVIDTNVRRVLGRHSFGSASPEAKSLALHASDVLPEGRAWEWNQALMDLGATVCTSRAPRCLVCPIRGTCCAHGAAVEQVATPAAAEERAPYRSAPFKGSNRYYRGRILACLRALPPGAQLSIAALQERLGMEAEGGKLEGLLAGLERDGLLVRSVDAPEAVALPL